MSIVAAWQQIPNPTITEILSLAGFDAIVFDMEHGEFTRADVMNCVRACESEISKYIRIKKEMGIEAAYCIDRGIDGIIISDVKNESEVEIFREQLSNIGFGLCNRNKWSLEKDNAIDYVGIICQIESLEGITNINEIIKLCDAVMIGPYDLSKSLGDIGNFNSCKYLECEKIFNKIKGYKRCIHIAKYNSIVETLDRYRDYGFIALGMDTTILLDSMKKIRGMIK